MLLLLLWLQAILAQVLADHEVEKEEEDQEDAQDALPAPLAGPLVLGLVCGQALCRSRTHSTCCVKHQTRSSLRRRCSFSRHTIISLESSASCVYHSFEG